MLPKGFHTFRCDMKVHQQKLTASMEDYLEMIYRLSLKDGYSRIYELSKSLNVKPPSVTSMVKKIGKLKLLKYEKYGIVVLTDKGKKLGKELIERHLLIEKFLTILGINNKEILKETEIIEHTISNNTLNYISLFVRYLEDNKDILIDYRNKYFN